MDLFSFESDIYDNSRVQSLQEMFKTTAEHPKDIPLNGTALIPGLLKSISFIIYFIITFYIFFILSIFNYNP